MGFLVSAGGRLQPEDVSPFARHGPLHELRQLFGAAPDRQDQTAFERGVLEPRLGPASGTHLRTMEEDVLPEPRRRGREPVPSLQPASRFLVPRLRGLTGFAGTDEARGFVE